MWPDNGRPSRLTSAMISRPYRRRSNGRAPREMQKSTGTDAGIRKKILVDNPAQLYGF